MNKEIYNESKNLLDKISKLLEDNSLNVEERKTLEIHKARLAGLLVRSWLPSGVIRKSVMFLIGSITAYLFLSSSFIFAFIMLVLFCIFSPRVVGEMIPITTYLKIDDITLVQRVIYYVLLLSR